MNPTADIDEMAVVNVLEVDVHRRLLLLARAGVEGGNEVSTRGTF